LKVICGIYCGYSCASAIIRIRRRAGTSMACFDCQKVERITRIYYYISASYCILIHGKLMRTTDEGGIMWKKQNENNAG
jgi:hypothetical protein